MDSALCAPNIKITIGMCVKDCESTIKEAIESALDQDYPCQSMELVIVDGCSRDRTLKIIEDSLKTANIRVKVFSENEGLGRARQFVVDNTSGDYIVWVDGDMVIARDFVRKQVDFMEHHPSVGIAKGKYGVRINTEGKNIVATLENVRFLLETAFEGETNSKALGTSGCIYRVKAIKQIGGFNPHIKGAGEDMDVENRVREQGWLLYISPSLFYEMRRKTWRSLWDEYFWHGISGRYIREKNMHITNLYEMFPPIAILAELFRVPAAYRLTHQKLVLFLPFHYTFKRIAWILGFIKSFLEKDDSKKEML